MMYAANRGHLAVVQLLVSSGADTNIQDTVSYIYTTPTLLNKHNNNNNNMMLMMMFLMCLSLCYKEWFDGYDVGGK